MTKIVGATAFLPVNNENDDGIRRFQCGNKDYKIRVIDKVLVIEHNDGSVFNYINVPFFVETIEVED
jgi:hypothetical protein